MADRGTPSTWTDDELDAAPGALHRQPDPVRAALPDARARLFAALAVEEAAQPVGTPEHLPVPPARPARPVRRRSWSVGTVAVAAVVVVLVVANPLDPGPTTAPSDPGAPTASIEPGTPTASAAELMLTRAANATIATFDVPVGPGQYRYVAQHVSAVSQTSHSGFRNAYRTRTWIPADETREWTQVNERLGPFEQIWGTAEAGAADRPWAEQAGPPDGEVRAVCGNFIAVQLVNQPSCEGLEPQKETTSAYLGTLPRDPQRLLAELTDDVRPADGPALRAQTMIQHTVMLLRSGLVPTDLRGAMYEALALLPEMRVTEQVANLDGQQGTALGVAVLGIRWDIIIDPTTGAFIGEREVQVTASPDGAPAGTVLGSTSVTTGVVDGVGTEPTS
jgi:hypothetical protein